jgi:acetylornithine deacetylase/succinyl-diaminopimelate desuccinylase-like protein
MKNLCLIICLVVCLTGCNAVVEIQQAWIDEAIGWFEGLLQIDSGREGAAVAFIKAILDAEGIQNTVYELPVIPGIPLTQPLLLAKLPGQEGYDNILLASHSDTVGVGNMPENLVFSGAHVNGYIYGRGAMDMKQKVILDLTTIVWAKRLQVPLKRGIIYGVFPGEEVGLLGAVMTIMTPVGAELANVGLVLDEGGGMTVQALGKTFMPVAIGEKGGCVFELSVQKTDGHATNYVPMEDCALFIMAEALISASKTIPPPHYTEVSNLMLDEIEQAVHPRLKSLVHDLKNPEKFEKAIKKIIATDALGAKFLFPQLVNLFNVVGFDAYTWETIIPGKATSKAGKLTIPGTINNCEIAKQELIESIGNVDVQVTTSQLTGMTPEQAMAFGMGVTINPFNPNVDLMMNSIKESTGVIAPDVVVIHSVFQAISDCMVFTNYMGVPCLGFEPTIMFNGDYFLDYFHSDDERIPEEGFKTGMKIYYNSIVGYTTA